MAETCELPETVAVCGLCRGYGAYVQRFLEGNITHECEMCNGAQFVYKCSGLPVPESVRQQIKNSNDLIERSPRLSWGKKLWPKESIDINDYDLTPWGACYEIKSEWPAKPVVEKRK